MRSFDVDYETVDVEIIPANIFGPGVPADSIRLKVKKTCIIILDYRYFCKTSVQTFSRLF
jgi:hypothetical protein